MKTPHTTFLILATLAGHAAAVTLSVNFQGRVDTTTSTPALATTTVAGAVAVSQWNNIVGTNLAGGALSGTTGGLNNSDGDATAVTLTYAANDSWRDGAGGGNGNQQMTYGFIKTNSTTTPATFTFNNLPTTSYNYTLYLYGVVNNSTALGPDAIFSVTGGPSKTLREGTGSRATLTEDSQYVTLSGQRTGDLTFTMAWPSDPDGAGGVDGAALSGVQLVYTAVPEPSVLGLFGFASLLLVRRRR